MFTQNEDVIRTRHEKILVVKSNGITGEAGRQENNREYLERQIEELCRIADLQDAGALRRKLKEIIPEFSPQAMAPLVRVLPANGNGSSRELKVA